MERLRAYSPPTLQLYAKLSVCLTSSFPMLDARFTITIILL
jgi:hypothetical protein